MNNSVKTNEITNNVQSEKHETNNKTNNMNNAGHKIIEVNFYKKLNRILSVAAVSLTVVIVGGTAIYFNKNLVLEVIGNIYENKELLEK